MHLLLAAMSGWGKSLKAQHVIEKNTAEYQRVIVLDFKDEFRGLVDAGMADWWILGPREAEWSTSTWQEFLAANPKVVLARHERLSTEDWMQAVAPVIDAARRLGDVLIAIDEAHFVAPQVGRIPDPIKGLATTGRGEGASSVWVTQRLAEIEKTVTSQCNARLLGGFESGADLDAVGRVAEYPQELHNKNVNRVGKVPEELLPDDRETPHSLQKHKNDQGDTIGSEWIFSDETGQQERRDTRGLTEEMQTTHYGRQGKEVKV